MRASMREGGRWRWPGGRCRTRQWRRNHDASAARSAPRRERSGHRIEAVRRRHSGPLDVSQGQSSHRTGRCSNPATTKAMHQVGTRWIAGPARQAPSRRAARAPPMRKMRATRALPPHITRARFRFNRAQAPLIRASAPAAHRLHSARAPLGRPLAP